MAKKKTQSPKPKQEPSNQKQLVIVLAEKINAKKFRAALPKDAQAGVINVRLDQLNSNELLNDITMTLTENVKGMIGEKDASK